LSEPWVHFIGSAIAGAAVSTSVRFIEDKKTISTKQITVDIVTFGIIGAAVDLDHLPYILGQNGYIDPIILRKPLHHWLPLISTIIGIIPILLRIMGFKRPPKETALIFGLLAAIFCHYVLDYWIIFMVYKKHLICFLSDEQGNKIKLLFSLFGPGP